MANASEMRLQRLPRESARQFFHRRASHLRRVLERLSGEDQEYPFSHNKCDEFVRKINQFKSLFNVLRFVQTEAAFRSRLAVYSMTIPSNLNTQDWTVLHREIMPELERVMRLALEEHGQFSFHVIQHSEFEKPLANPPDLYDKYYKRKMQNILTESEIRPALYQHLQYITRRIAEDLEEWASLGSGWIHKRVIRMDVRVSRYRALRGSSYVPLPKYLAVKKAIINVKNEDDQCFKWAVLAAIHQNDVARDRERVSNYKPFENELNFDGIEFPVELSAISKFERQNRRAIFVYHLADDHKSIQPLRMSNMRVPYSERIRLFYYKEHYMWIKNHERLLSNQTQHKAQKHFCDYCCSSFNSKDNRDAHEQRCMLFDQAQEVKMPAGDKCLLRFKSYAKMLKVPFVVYADFEALNLPDDGTLPGPSDKTEYLTRHEPCSFKYIIVRSDGAIFRHRLYRGKEAAAKFINWLKDDIKEIDEALQEIAPMQLSASDEHDFEVAQRCHICQRSFENSDRFTKVRDHCHITGQFRGAAHKSCNLNFRFSPKVPVFFHNLRGYDSHLIIQGAEAGNEIEVIANNLEKYMSFTLKRRIAFKDSMQFLPAGLDGLVKTLRKEDFRITSQFFQGEKLELMRRKGLCPYSYLDGWERFDETEPPPPEAFFNDLKGEAISADDYQHVLNVWRVFEIKNLGEYVDLYLKADVLLLADVFETFRKNALEIYKLDPAHYITSPHLAFDALLYTRINDPPLELLTDPDMHILFEQGMRGGISVASHRHVKANPGYLFKNGVRIKNPDFDPSKPSSYIMYLDANNLYGWAMKQLLPVRGFRWWMPDEMATLTEGQIRSWAKDGKKGYILMVDLRYPQHLHDAHADYPLAPETIKVTKDMLSPFQHMLADDLKMGFAAGKKLAPNLMDKEMYTVHYRNLQFYLEHGLEIVKVHKVLEFEQASWMEAYIDMNTSLRAQTQSDFLKDLYKLMNNSVFGKTMENVRNRKDVRFPKDLKQLRKLTASSRLYAYRIFKENLAAIELLKTSVVLNKPVYTGFTVLELSKLLMFQFWYECLKPLYGDKARLQYTDTDSLIIHIETDDVYADMKEHEEWFDFSDYPKDHPCFSTANKKIPGKMKDELNSELILEFVAVRAKLYSVLTETGNKKKAKGVAKYITKNELTHEDYVRCVEECQPREHQMLQIRSKRHNLYTLALTKTTLNPLDTKRWICEDGITTLPFGHYSTVEDRCV